MMIPDFDITQNDVHVIVRIHSPYYNDHKIIHMTIGKTFRFINGQHILSLFFSQNLVETTSLLYNYDPIFGTFIYYLQKLNIGEKFTDLDGTKLLAMDPTSPERSSLYKNEVRVIRSPMKDLKMLNPLDMTWDDLEKLFDASEDKYSLNYGFGLKYSGLHPGLIRKFDHMSFSIAIPAKSRSYFMEKIDILNFDENQIDLLESLDLDIFLSVEQPWLNDQMKIRSNKQNKILTTEFLSQEDIYLTNILFKRTLLGLIDLLWAYFVEYRTCEACGDEFLSQNIIKLVQHYHGLRFMIVFMIVSISVLEEHFVIHDAFNGGLDVLLSCMLDIHWIFSHDEENQVMNNLYITEYCLWLKSLSSNSTLITTLAETLQNTSPPSKSSFGIDFMKIEKSRLYQTINRKNNQNNYGYI